MKRLIFTPKAIRKINQIEKYISSEFGSQAAKDAKRLLKKRIKSLKSFPYQGESIRDIYGFDTSLRRLYVSPNNIIYEVSEDIIKINDIFHEREDFIMKLFG